MDEKVSSECIYFGYEDDSSDHVNEMNLYVNKFWNSFVKEKKFQGSFYSVKEVVLTTVPFC